MTLPPNPVFQFQGETYSVKVENVARSVSRHDIVKLFTTLIDEVTNCCEYHDEQKRRAFILEFSTPDASKKALCMSGYTVAGMPINVVSASAPPEPRRVNRHGRSSNDDRRNLYVLGLPFDLNKTEFMEVFSRFGGVAHAVILATVDNASRRRGFIVMNSHREAKAAMDGLSRKEIKGHTIDVSWAVVQRSQGFLDGGDRAMVLSQQNNSSGPTVDYDAVDSVASPETPAICTPPMDDQFQTLGARSAPVLLVTNVPTMLFSDVGDLHPLLCPFGDIVQLKVLNQPTDVGSLSATVEYKNMGQAREARASLDGQLYADRCLKVDFLLPEAPSPVSSEFSVWSTSASEGKLGLNPFAAPFQVHAGASGASSPAFGPFKYNVTGSYASDEELSLPRHWSGYSTPHLAFPSHQSRAHAGPGLLAPSLASFRPRSAPSHSGNEPRVLRPGNWTSYDQEFPTTFSTSTLSTFST